MDSLRTDLFLHYKGWCGCQRNIHHVVGHPLSTKHHIHQRFMNSLRIALKTGVAIVTYTHLMGNYPWCPPPSTHSHSRRNHCSETAHPAPYQRLPSHLQPFVVAFRQMHRIIAVHPSTPSPREPRIHTINCPSSPRGKVSRPRGEIDSKE